MADSTYETISARIDAIADELIEASHAIHANPELAFKEHFACETLTKALDEHDLQAGDGRVQPGHGLRGTDQPRPMSVRRWPCSPSTTPCPASDMPAGTTSSPPRRWGLRWVYKQRPSICRAAYG